jgi:cytochrome c
MRAALIFVVLAASTPAAAQVSAQHVARRGQLLFLQCRACHSLKAGEPHRVGPNLNGFLTRPGASAPGYKYSVAFAAAKPRWTDATLDAWLARPGLLVKGTTMAFAGVGNEEDRALLIAYLKSATK